MRRSGHSNSQQFQYYYKGSICIKPTVKNIIFFILKQIFIAAK